MTQKKDDKEKMKITSFDEYLKRYSVPRPPLQDEANHESDIEAASRRMAEKTLSIFTSALS